MEIQREETHMRSSAKYRPFEISHVSVGDYFAALQIDLCVRGWIGAFATLAAYAIPISSRTMSFSVDNKSHPSKTRQLYHILRWDESAYVNPFSHGD